MRHFKELQANITRDAWGNIVIQMQGPMCVDSSVALDLKLQALLQQHHGHLSFDFSGVDFVASSGVGHFVQTLINMSQRKDINITIRNIDSQYEKVMKVYGLTDQHVYFDSFGMDDDSTEHLSSYYNNRKRTFEN